MFHSTESMVSAGLTILAAGLSLSITGAFSIILGLVSYKIYFAEVYDHIDCS